MKGFWFDMDTPKAGTIIEYIQRKYWDDCIYVGYSAGERFMQNRLGIATMNYHGNFSMYTTCQRWRYPGETEWRR